MKNANNTLQLNIAGNKIEFKIEVENTYDNNADFKVTKDGWVLLSGYVSDSSFGLHSSVREIIFFENVLIKKVKTELKKLKIKFR